MNLKLEGRVAAVAAASKGLGRATALELAKEGADVAICGRNQERIAEAAQAIEYASQQHVLAVVADLSTHQGCLDFVQKTVQHFGQIDILVANAGGPPSLPAEQVVDEQWRAAIDLNLLSTIRMVYAALPHLKQSDQGRVIAITSVSAKHPLDNLILSNVTRAGVLGFVKSMANELGSSSITFNAILPGWTRTGRVEELLQSLSTARGISPIEVEQGITAGIPAQRMGTVDEFAATVAFLASQRAGFVNGVALQVDGGHSAGLL